MVLGATSGMMGAALGCCPGSQASLGLLGWVLTWGLLLRLPQGRCWCPGEQFSSFCSWSCDKRS